jgi:hypothetical protein
MVAGTLLSPRSATVVPDGSVKLHLSMVQFTLFP